MVKIGEGKVSEAYLEGNRVTLIGKREDSFENYERLKRNLDLLDGKIKNTNIPKNAVLIERCEQYPYGAFGFDYVKGKELKYSINLCSDENKKNIGKSLAKFVEEMQSIDFAGNKEEEITINLNKLKKSLILLEKYMDEKERDYLDHLVNKYEEFMVENDFCLTHGDLQEENILLDDENNLVGIIDFGNMEYYVKEIEFVSMMNYDSVIFNSMIDNYKGKLNVENIKLIALVKQIRFFKHVSKDEERIANEVNKIKKMIRLLK